MVIIGCGTPKKSVGWRHLSNILGGLISGAHVSAVVEPWLLEAGKDTSGGKAFQAFCDEVCATNPDLVFAQAVENLPPFIGPTLAIIAGRTSDAPLLFEQAVKHGATHVYLEKHGAENAASKGRLCQFAKERDVVVVMGYVCNVSTFIQHALAYEAEVKASGEVPKVEICRVNHYTTETLGECFARNSEGLLHNMLGHDLALAVSFWCLRADNIREITIDNERTSLEEHGGLCDFSKLAFDVHMEEGNTLSFTANRCGARLQDPDVMPYFIRMRKGYQKLLSATVEHICTGKAGVPPGAVTLEMGRQVLLVADKLDEMLKMEMQKTSKHD